MRTRKRKLSAVQQKTINQVIEAIPAVIERIETQEQAEQMESHIWKLRTSGFISDRQYNIFMKNIIQCYMRNNGIVPGNEKE